jgi:hypothetical protein
LVAKDCLRLGAHVQQMKMCNTGGNPVFSASSEVPVLSTSLLCHGGSSFPALLRFEPHGGKFDFFNIAFT